MSNLWANTNYAKKRKKYANEVVENNLSESREELIGSLYRTSSENQRDNDSIDTQQKLLLKWINANGGVLIEEYHEEATSAFHNKAWERPELMRMLNDVKEGHINHVVFFKRDRLARDIDSARFIYNLLRENGAKLSFTDTSEPPVDLQKLDFASEVIEMMHYASNNYESRKTQVRVSSVMYEIAQEGRWTGGQAPLGYQIEHINDETYLKPVDWFIPTVQLIEEMYFNGLGMKSIARWLNGEEVKGVESPKGTTEKPITNSKVSKVWNEKNVDTILFNPVFSGYIHYNPHFLDEEPVIVKSKYITPIRSEDTQLQLNKLRDNRGVSQRNAKKFNTPFLLTGILKCGCCGTLYGTNTSQQKEGSKHSYYKCKNKYALSHAIRCKSSLTFRKNVLEYFIKTKVSELLEVLIDEETYNIYLELANKKNNSNADLIQSYNEKLLQNKKKIDNFLRLLGELDVDSPAYSVMKESYESGLLAGKKEEMQLLEGLKELESSDQKVIEDDMEFSAFMRDLKKYKGLFPTIHSMKFKQILDKLFSEIIVDAEGNVILRFNDMLQLKEPPKDITPFIFNTMNGEGIVVESINNVYQSTVLVYNYHKFVTSIKSTIHKALWEFMKFHDRKLYDLSAHNVDYSQSNSFSNITSFEKNILNSYFDNKFLTVHSTRNRIKNGMSISENTFFTIMKKLKVNTVDFSKYLQDNYSLALSDVDIVDIIKKSNHVVNNGDVYKDKLVCGECGSKIREVQRNLLKTYRCIKSRNDYGKNRCYNKSVNVKVIEDYLKKNNITIENVTNLITSNGMIISHT